MKSTHTSGFIEQRLLIALFALFIIGVGIFATSRAQSLIIGPTIEVNHTVMYEDIEEGLVTISGEVERATYFAINDRIVTPEQDGNFAIRLFPTPGHTIMKITARDRFNRETTQNLFIYAPHHGTEEINIQETDQNNQSSPGGEEERNEQGEAGGQGGTIQQG